MPAAQLSPVAPHGALHAPQWARFVATMTHDPSQHVAGASHELLTPQGETQTPPTHVVPDAQTLPPHVVGASTHCPPTQTRPWAQVTAAQGSLGVDSEHAAKAESTHRTPLFTRIVLPARESMDR